MSTTTVVSAPGKVLVAGGYLVLDQKYSGTVVSASSRFYTVIKGSSDAASTGGYRIRVRSPQFENSVWDYDVKTDGGKIVVENAATNESKNKFVHLALQHTLALAAEIKGVETVNKVFSSSSNAIDIAIVGDNDFYSQREKLASLNLPRTISSLAHIPPFVPTGVTLSNVHKTGLGSSASLITSLVSALLIHFSVIPRSSLESNEPVTSENASEGRLLAHNAAQFIHCFAQGKVGSGFDVSSAVFGSHVYTRFNPAVIQALMKEDAVKSQALHPVLSPSNKDWDYKVQLFRLPPLTRLVLADVDAGSDTPSLVGKVLKWRTDNPEQALELWTALDNLNTKVAQTLNELSSLYDKDPETYTACVKYIASLQPIQWGVSIAQTSDELPIVSKFFEVFNLTEAIRAKMREMGSNSGVPIEPSEQTELLDSCVQLAGVIGGGVPGAGGYDAIWLLICDPVDASPDVPPLERVEKLWSEYTKLNVSPLSTQESRAGGARVEEVDKVKGLAEAISV